MLNVFDKDDNGVDHCIKDIDVDPVAAAIHLRTPGRDTSAAGVKVQVEVELDTDLSDFDPSPQRSITP